MIAACVGGAGGGAVPPDVDADACAAAAAAAACWCCSTDCVGTNAGGCFYAIETR